MKAYKFCNLRNADLVVDAIYEGGATGNTSDDPISRLLPGSGNAGGFRAAGTGDAKRFVVLYSSGRDMNWPDSIDLNMGQFVYFGDNKKPGQELHKTHGNRILRNVFEWLHELPHKRNLVPPFFVFTNFPTRNSSRSVQFRGLVAPGYPGMPPTEDLVATWRTSGGRRFQNYRAVFSLLNIPVVPRTWLNSLSLGEEYRENVPETWRKWVVKGIYELLRSEPTTITRTTEQQSPKTPEEIGILETVYRYFSDSPFLFERFAAEIFKKHDERVSIDLITRPTMDGGRDAIGRYRFGLADDPVHVKFALEAKCYRPRIHGSKANSIGVTEVARLISRLRHREFGVLVTTSVISKQAYHEVRQDEHPIVFITGKDIVDILVSCGYSTSIQVKTFLENEIPKISRRED